MGTLAVGSGFEAYFVTLRAMLNEHGSESGTTTPPLFRCSSRGRKSDRGSRANAAHVSTFVEPADSRSRGRGRCATLDAPRSGHRTDAGWPSLSGTRPLGAIAGCGCNRSCSPGRSSHEAMLLDRLSDRTRIGVDARSVADPARRTAQHRRDDFESILATAG